MQFRGLGAIIAALAVGGVAAISVSKPAAALPAYAGIVNPTPAIKTVLRIAIRYIIAIPPA